MIFGITIELSAGAPVLPSLAIADTLLYVDTVCKGTRCANFTFQAGSVHRSPSKNSSICISIFKVASEIVLALALVYALRDEKRSYFVVCIVLMASGTHQQLEVIFWFLREAILHIVGVDIFNFVRRTREGDDAVEHLQTCVTKMAGNAGVTMVKIPQ